MACNSDYMKQTYTEEMVQKTAALLVYTLKSLNKKVPKYILELSKNMYAQDPDDKLVPMLCKTCKQMTKKQKEDIIYNARNPQSRKLADWWDEHQEADKMRVVKEKEEAVQKKLVKSALKKITKSEAAALKIYFHVNMD